LAYHLQTDGQTERVNREVEKFLRMFMNLQQDDWVDWLPLTEFTYNNAVHEVTGETPFFLNQGRHPRTLPSDPLTSTDSSAGTFLENLRQATKSVEESLRKAKEAMKMRWDGHHSMPIDYQERDQVLVSAEKLPSTQPLKKLDMKWRGPFRMLRKVREAAYELDLPASWKVERTFHEG
jgi:hypothetical protein